MVVGICAVQIFIVPT